MKPRESSVGDAHAKVLPKSNCPVKESCSSHKRPLHGKCFYLDLPYSKKAEILERDIRTLGGTIEKFFSKEIKYLVSDKKEAKYVRSLGRNSPVPSPDSGQSSPQPSSRRESPKGSSQGLAETVITSRGKSLVKKVVKEQEQIKINGILSNALEWGVKILYVDDMLSYVEKRKSDLIAQNKLVLGVKKDDKTGSSGSQALHKFHCGRINRPFVKVEDSSRHYKPIYRSMPYLPEFNFTATPPCTPFHVEDWGKEVQGRKTKECRNKDQRPAGSQAGVRSKPPKVKSKAPEVREKKRAGYCECCLVKYEALKMHLKSEQHKAFSKTDAYLVVDRLVSGMAFDFVEMNKETQREKLSISSVVHVSMPRVSLEERQEEEVQRPRVGAEGDDEVEGNQTDPSRYTPVSCRPRKRSRAPLYNGNSPEALVHACGPERSHTLGAERLNALEPEHLCQPAECNDCDKMLVSACTQPSDSRAAGACVKLNTGDLASNKNDHPVHSSLDVVENSQCSVVAKSPKMTCGQPAAASALTWPVQGPVTECGQSPEADGKVLQPGAVRTVSRNPNPSGTRGSPVRKLQRKVRDLRRRQKTNKRTPGRCAKDDSKSCSLHSLWQLFESSDSTDYEFKGFELQHFDV